MTALPTPTARPTGQAAQPGGDRYLLGPISATIDCPIRSVRDDFRHLYGDMAISHLQQQSDVAINVTIETDGLHLPWHPKYRLLGDGELMYQRQPTAGVLPHLEWVINRRTTLRLTSRLQLHAASLARNGRGIIMAARSSCGKSTLTAALVAAGWSYLCDEFAMINPKTLGLHAFPRALCLKQGSFDTAKRLGLALHKPGCYATAFKGPVAYIPPRTLSMPDVSDSHPVAAVILPQYRPDCEPRLIDIPPAEAVLALAELAFNRHAFGADAINMLTQICTGAHCCRLISNDLHATVALLDNLVKAG